MSDDSRAWIDKLEIQELIYRYSDGVNRGDLTAIRSVFADDALWESPLLGFRYESADAFVDFFRVNTTTSELLIQTPHCPVIELTGPDSARATTTIHEFSKGTAAEDGPFGPQGAEVNFQDYGIYYDDLARIDGGWKFTHRHFVPTYLESGVVNGEAPIERSKLMGRAPA